MESRHPQITHESSYNAPFQFLDLGAASGQRRTQQCSLSIHTSLSSRHCRPIAPALGTTSAYALRSWLQRSRVLSSAFPNVKSSSTQPPYFLDLSNLDRPFPSYIPRHPLLTNQHRYQRLAPIYPFMLSNVRRPRGGGSHSMA